MTRKSIFAWPVWVAAISILLLTSCEREPNKSDYVSARVTEMCKGRSGPPLQACRIAVITKFKDTPFEEMKRKYPKPTPRKRPACGLG